MNERVAVMDLETNTFHLLIAEGHERQFRTVVNEEVAVMLGEGGINAGQILPAAFQRGVRAMQEFKKQIDGNKVLKIKCVATSALRNALNSPEFVEAVAAATGIQIEVISGEREAEYIYRGIKAAGALSATGSLLVDIGGGSVELIICNREDIFWKQSFEIGAARLMEKYHRRDPLSEASLKNLELELRQVLDPLFQALQFHPASELIGSSGAFETFAALAAGGDAVAYQPGRTVNYRFEKRTLLHIIDLLVHSDHNWRAANPLIIPVRTDMIVAASVITRYLIRRTAIDSVAVCSYSLKQGVLEELLEAP